MTLIADWLYALGAASVDVFWRPLLAWTLVFLPLYAGLRLWRSAPAFVQYHAHLALLLALPLGLALAPLVSWPTPEVAVLVGDVLPQPTLDGDAVVVPLAVPAVAQGLVWSVTHWIGVLTLIAAGCAVFLLIRMIFLAYALREFQQGLAPVEEPATHRLFRALAGEVGVRHDVALLATPDETTPMTFGWRRPVIVLPPGLLDDEPALRLTLRHELIHIRRRDYAVSWIVRLVSGLFAIHPGVWLLHRRIDQYRELSCDAETLGAPPVGARRYARLLMRFSPLTDLAGPTALRMADLDSTLKKRINAMHNPARFTSSVRLRRWSLPLAALLLIGPALLAACATETNTSETVVVTTDDERGEQAEQEVTRDRLTEREREMAALREAEEMIRQTEQQELEVKLVQEREGALQGKYSTPKLQRLELQMAYLQGQIQEAASVMEKLERQEREPDEKSEVTRSAYILARQRHELLNAMYMRRLEEFETMKMEQFTRDALAERGDGE